MDHWNDQLLCKDFEIKGNNALSLNVNDCWDWRTAFGSNIISIGQKYQWRFMIKIKSSLDRIAAIFFGISPWPIHEELLNRSDSQDIANKPE